MKWNAAEVIEKNFHDFLVEQEVDIMFYMNFIRHQEEQEEWGFDTVQEFLLETPMINWISSAFPWDMEEGESNLWATISRKFEKDFLGV